MDKNVVRRRQRLFRYAVDLFIELVGRGKKRTFNYKCNATDISCFEKFLNHYKNNIGEEYIRKYSEYQMQSWFNDNSTKSQADNIRFTWFFGEKAIKRWEKFSIDFNVRLTREDIKTKINLDTSVVKTTMSKFVLELIDAEEKHKKKYLNSKHGLNWCIANTTLYFHKSPVCAICNFKKDCKEILKENYNKIYILRGYESKTC